MYDHKHTANITSRSTQGLFLGLTTLFALSACLPLPGADGRIAHLPTLCPFRTLTGLPCPACGLTRSFVCLSHGQWMPSLHWHPIGWLMYGVLLLLWARAGLTWLLGRPVLALSERLAYRLSWVAASILLLVGTIRIGVILTDPSLRLP